MSFVLGVVPLQVVIGYVLRRDDPRVDLPERYIAADRLEMQDTLECFDHGQDPVLTLTRVPLNEDTPGVNEDVLAEGFKPAISRELGGAILALRRAGKHLGNHHRVEQSVEPFVLESRLPAEGNDIRIVILPGGSDPH